MFRSPILAMIIPSVLMTPLICAQQAPPAAPQQQAQPSNAGGNPPDENAVREAAAKAKADLDHKQMLADQTQAQLDSLHALHPMTPAERADWQRRFFPDFMKKVGELNRTSIGILSLVTHENVDLKTRKEIGKRSKTLEDSADWIVGYLLAGEKAPTEPEVAYSSLALAERVWVLKYSVPSIVERITKTYRPRQAVVDAKSEHALIQDLQSVKVLGRSLRQ